MPSTTSRLGLDYALSTDAVSGYPASDQQAKTILDTAAIYEEGTLAARPAATGVAHGTFYHSTDTGDVSYSNGTAWLSMLLFGGGNGALNPTSTTAATISAAAGQLVVAYSSSAQTITLPASPTSGNIVGVMSLNASGAAPKTISAGSNAINGVGLATLSSFTLGTSGASVVLVWDGGHWEIVSGQPDTGWVALTLGTNIASGGQGASARVIGDHVYLKGTLTNNTGATFTGTWATVPAGLRPDVAVSCPASLGESGYNPIGVQVAATGAITGPSGGVAAGSAIDLTGVDYPLS